MTEKIRVSIPKSLLRPPTRGVSTTALKTVALWPDGSYADSGEPLSKSRLYKTAMMGPSPRRLNMLAVPKGRHEKKTRNTKHKAPSHMYKYGLYSIRYMVFVSKNVLSASL